jgi:adenylate kinase
MTTDSYTDATANTSARAQPQPAILLVGPTGCGKTPLGEEIERRGLAGRRCRHFDFGAWLRRAAARTEPDPFTRGELDFVRKILAEGALLEDEHFGIASKLFRWFLSASEAGEGDWVVLNGLPRHVGQAEALAPFARVLAVAHLVCTADVTVERIRRNTGGDRAGRSDDTPAAVTRRIETFETRTRPLIVHYRTAGARVVDLPVRADTAATDLWAMLEAALKERWTGGGRNQEEGT